MTGSARRLDWCSGGWLLLLTAGLVLTIVAWRVVPLLGTSSRAIGDGQEVDSYGFELVSLRVPRERLSAAGFPKDGIPALIDPPVMPGSAMTAFNEARRGKYLVSADRVIGVVVNGEARAYPVRALNWHEIVNDTLGEVPIAVTYHPLCDSVAVFDRRVAGETLEFRVSGLLYNSNQLIFDRRENAEAESLWSQLMARAIAGPAAEAGLALDVLPVSLARWDRWLEVHPDTTVIEPDPKLIKRYERNPYGNYFLTGQLRFPVDPLPPEDTHSPMQRMVVVETAEGRWVRPVGSPAAISGAWFEPLRGVRVWLESDEESYSVLVDAGPGVRVYHTMWFAWYALHPDVDS
jgi:hypothetical protein